MNISATCSRQPWSKGKLVGQKNTAPTVRYLGHPSKASNRRKNLGSSSLRSDHRQQASSLRLNQALGARRCLSRNLYATDDQRLSNFIKHSWLESGGVYGYRKLYDDLREVGEDFGQHRVARLMRLVGLRLQIGYRRRLGKYGGKPAVASPRLQKCQFDVVEPIWVIDISYIRTYECSLYLAVVLDLFSRQAVGRSMKSQMSSDLAIDALLMAVWRRKPKQEVVGHSDQGSQYSSSDWRRFLKANNLVASMSRRGHCHDNAVAESFFSL